MNTFYTSTTKADAIALQAKLRTAKRYPCCDCWRNPSADCPCDDHRRPDGTILKGPHSPGSCALEAVSVVENPKAKGEWVVPVPAEYEAHLAAKDKQSLTVKLAADVELAEPIAVAIEAEPVKEEPIDPKAQPMEGMATESEVLK